jgi:hypothetical protein
VLTEIGEHPPVGQAAVATDGEGREPPAHGLAHDQGGAIGGDDRSVGEVEALGCGLNAAVGLHQRDRRRSRRGPVVEVEAEVADVGAALPVDDHVVAVEGGHAGQVGVVDQPAARLEAQQLAVGHRDHEQPAVGQPAQA